MIIGRRCARRYASWMIGDESDLITLPIDMKNLGKEVSDSGLEGILSHSGETHPKVAPDPSINCPSVRMIPLGPAPYLAMLTVPARIPG